MHPRRPVAASTGRLLLALAALAALVAAAGAVGSAAQAPSVDAWWRALGLPVFAGLFALLA
jgi:hypothetical protein